MTEKQINKCYWNLNSNFNEFSKIELIMQDTVKIKKKNYCCVYFWLMTLPPHLNRKISTVGCF